MTTTHLPEVSQAGFSDRFTRVGWFVLLAGLVLASFAFVVDREQSTLNAIILFLFLASIAGGSVFLLALEYIAGAVWSVPMRRVNEFLAGLTPLVPLVALPVLFNLHDVFHWSHAQAVDADAALAAKRPYLNETFFVVRFVGVFVLWSLFSYLFVRNSTKQDTTKDPRLTTISIRLAAGFIPLFAITITILAVDWAMSLEPHWYSTIFGVYYFSGTVLAALAAATFIVIRLHETGKLPGLRRDHFYSLGALQFAFLNFWAYIAFSQFLLIWYANIPEETFWFIRRWEGGWEYWSILLIIVHFGVPYLALLSQDSKMDPRRLKIISLWILVAHLVDLYWLVMPTHHAALSLSWIDLVFPIVGVGMIMALLSFKVRRHSLVPVGDPKLQRGLDFRL